MAYKEIAKEIEEKKQDETCKIHETNTSSCGGERRENLGSI